MGPIEVVVARKGDHVLTAATPGAPPFELAGWTGPALRGEGAARHHRRVRAGRNRRSRPACGTASRDIPPQDMTGRRRTRLEPRVSMTRGGGGDTRPAEWSICDPAGSRIIIVASPGIGKAKRAAVTAFKAEVTARVGRERFGGSLEPMNATTADAGSAAVTGQPRAGQRRPGRGERLTRISLIVTSRWVRSWPVRAGCRPLLRDCRHPAVHPAADVYSHDRSVVVAGEEAAHSLHAAAGDDVLVPVAGQQADFFPRVAGGGSSSAAARICGLMSAASVITAPSTAMLRSMASFS